MTVQYLFKILLDEQEIELYSHKLHMNVWEGEAKDIPSCFFDNLVTSLYSLNGSVDSYLVISIE
jgi:hypothetical protein